MCSKEKEEFGKRQYVFFAKNMQNNIYAAAVKQKKEKKKEVRVLRVNAIDKPRSLRPSKPGSSALQKNLVKLIRW